MRSRTKTVITLETWRRTTVRIARETVATDEPAIEHRESSREIYRIVAPAADKRPTRSGIAGQKKLE